MAILKREPSMAIEWAALVIQFIALLSNIGLAIYLIRGNLQHKRMQKTILMLCAVGISFMTLSLANQYFFQSFHVDIFVRFLGSSTTLAMVLGHMEILKLLCVLTDYWTEEKVTKLQVSSAIFHYLFHVLFYTEPIFAIIKQEPPPFYITISHVLFTVSFTVLVVYCTANDVYLSYKVYKDAQNTCTARNGDIVEEQSRTIELKKKYQMLCLSFFFFTPTDAFACVAYNVGLWMDKSHIRFAYSLQRLAVSNLMLHAIYLTHIFLRIRDIKFSKPIKTEIEPREIPQTNTKDMVKYYFSFDRDKISRVFGLHGTVDQSH